MHRLDGDRRREGRRQHRVAESHRQRRGEAARERRVERDEAEGRGLEMGRRGGRVRRRQLLAAGARQGHPASALEEVRRLPPSGGDQVGQERPRFGPGRRLDPGHCFGALCAHRPQWGAGHAAEGRAGGELSERSERRRHGPLFVAPRLARHRLCVNLRPASAPPPPHPRGPKGFGCDGDHASASAAPPLGGVWATVSGCA
mmetsp:Transcript_13458/g.36925  ORF Transcript_13458/g.36925 Transcript_13458/m.36925 type:complete len:201 (-) Transcript_13458:114-716(-)